MARPECALRFEMYQVEHRQRLAKLIEQTYEQSCDLAELNGVRNISDVLDEYEHTGQFHPDRWRLVTHNEQDVGCLLMADHPRDNQWELVYMGLIPVARGKKWGTAIARYGGWLARQANCERLMLAVDAKNLPALSVYNHVGFEIVDRRKLFLKIV